MIGTGYVGLVSGVCFSDFGHEVVCVDKDPAKIERLGQGVVPIYEPGLDALIDKNVAAGRLKFTTDVAQAIEDAGVMAVESREPRWEQKNISTRAAVIQRGAVASRLRRRCVKAL